MPKMYKREFNVYKIVNDIDDMVYIGSTTTELWHRMSQHRSDAVKGAKSPLYKLMRKYGIDHFKIVSVMISDSENIRKDEEKVISSVKPELRLNYKNRTANDNSEHYDYDEICRIYLSTGSQNQTANIVGCSRITVQKALRSRNIKITYPPHTAHKFKEIA